MEKKLYWQIEDNGDLSCTCSSPEECLMILEGEFNSLNDDEKEEAQYTITPVYLTEKEFENLPEA